MIDPIQTFNQLANANNGLNRLKMMIGAKHFFKNDDDSYVGFRFMRGAANKANYIKITLNAMDTYDVEFGRVHGTTHNVVSTHEGIYDDMLYGLFIAETKLSLKI